MIYNRKFVGVENVLFMYSNHRNVHLPTFALQTFDSNVNYTNEPRALVKLAKQEDFCLRCRHTKTDSFLDIIYQVTSPELIRSADTT